ncbi:MAG: response regulator [Sandaracinaceae bacterium]|nr:response regulator [Sandaracinaceae bacterium]
MTPGHILIVDDDPDFVAVYREMLEGLGLHVSAVHDAAAATARLETDGRSIDVVLIDQKLQGPGGGDTGLELIARAQSLAPFAKLIVVTGYAKPEAIERAFTLGVYDYLVKNGAFEALLTAKVRNAVEITAERRMAALSREQMVAELRSTWKKVTVEKNRQRKGKLLEELVRLLFRATPGFERVETRLDNATEEIDIVVENRSDQPPWRSDAGYLLGECKNWSKKCGAPELRAFLAKLETKYARARTGFFVAPGGFTAEFERARAERKLDELLVIPVDREDLERWIDSDDRLAVLNALHKKAVFHTKA